MKMANSHSGTQLQAIWALAKSENKQQNYVGFLSTPTKQDRTFS